MKRGKTMALDVDIKKEEISTLTVDERKKLQKQVETTLNRLLCQKLLFAIVVVLGCKLSVSEYLNHGLTIIIILETFILFSVCVIYRSMYQYERVLKEIKKTLLKMEQSESVPQ